MPYINLISYAIFGVLALVTVISALQVASARSIIHAAFWLFPVFAGVAGFYLLLDAQFLAAIQVLIYIGAILVLIIFAVTLTRNAAGGDEAQANRYVPAVIVSAVMLLLALVGAAAKTDWVLPPYKSVDAVLLMPNVPNVSVTDMSAIGLVLLQQYLLPFEIASVLLLAAMIGAIVLARKERETPAADAAGESSQAVEVPVVSAPAEEAPGGSVQTAEETLRQKVCA